MPSIEGPISSRLRKMFSKSDPVWHPIRPADVPAKKGKIPKGVDGQKLGGRHRKK